MRYDIRIRTVQLLLIRLLMMQVRSVKLPHLLFGLKLLMLMLMMVVMAVVLVVVIADQGLL